MSVIDDFLAIAKKEIGYEETKTNITKYNEWADRESFWFTKVQGCAWCGTFIAWCFWKLAHKYHFSEVDACMDEKCCWVDHWKVNFMEAKRFLLIPEPGDIAFRNGHVGIVTSYNSLSDTVFTIEGNYNDGVRAVARTFAEWLGFGRPKWDNFKLLPQTTSETTSAKEFLINQGIYIGKDDGEMHWEDNLTREEMALILYRYWRKFNK